MYNKCVQVNPYEIENVADTLNRALEMPLDERQLRYKYEYLFARFFCSTAIREFSINQPIIKISEVINK